MKQRYIVVCLIFITFLLVLTSSFINSNYRTTYLEQENIGLSFINDSNFYEYENLFISEIFDKETGLNVEFFRYPELLEEFLKTERLMELQGPAIAAYNLIMQEFVVIEYDGIWFEFPDDYGGAFIYDNKLIVQLTDLSEDNVSLYLDLAKDEAVVEFTQVVFSLNELYNYGELFLEVLEEVGMSVASYGIDTFNNKFNITLYDNNYLNISLFNRILETTRAQTIPIRLSVGSTLEEDTTLEGGSAITVANGGVSIGAAGESRVPGHTGSALITTGHATGIRLGSEVLRNNVIIGNVVAFRNGNTGTHAQNFNGDWAVVRLNQAGAAGLTNRIRNGRRITSQHFARFLPVGTVVSGSGRTTLNFSGTIAYTNQNFGTTRGVKLITPTGNTTPYSGDSGGTIFTGSGNNVVFEGVYVGRLLLNGVIQHWAYSPHFWSHQLFIPRTVN